MNLTEQERTMQRFSAMLGEFYGLWGRDVTPIMIAGWYRQLQLYSLDEISDAFDFFVTTKTGRKLCSTQDGSGRVVDRIPNALMVLEQLEKTSQRQARLKQEREQADRLALAAPVDDTPEPSAETMEKMTEAANMGGTFMERAQRMAKLTSQMTSQQAGD